MDYTYTLQFDQVNGWLVASIVDASGKLFRDCVLKDTSGLTHEDINTAVAQSVRTQLAEEAAIEAERIELASRLAAINALVADGEPTTLNIA